MGSLRFYRLERLCYTSKLSDTDETLIKKDKILIRMRFGRYGIGHLYFYDDYIIGATVHERESLTELPIGTLARLSFVVCQSLRLGLEFPLWPSHSCVASTMVRTQGEFASGVPLPVRHGHGLNALAICESCFARNLLVLIRLRFAQGSIYINVIQSGEKEIHIFSLTLVVS